VTGDEAPWRPSDHEHDRLAQLASASQIAAVASGELWRQGPALLCLAHKAAAEGAHERAFQLTAEALELFRRTGDKWPLGQHLLDLAYFQFLAGQYADAEATVLEPNPALLRTGGSVERGRWLGDSRGCAGGTRSCRPFSPVVGSDGSVARPQRLTRIGARELLGDAPFEAALKEGRRMSLEAAVQ
jgi:hypothetical protein